MRLMMKAKISRPGLRGGKYWIDKKGEVIYGERPHPKARQASHDEINQHHKKPSSYDVNGKKIKIKRKDGAWQIYHEGKHVDTVPEHLAKDEKTKYLQKKSGEWGKEKSGGTQKKDKERPQNNNELPNGYKFGKDITEAEKQTAKSGLTEYWILKENEEGKKEIVDSIPSTFHLKFHSDSSNISVYDKKAGKEYDSVKDAIKGDKAYKDKRDSIKKGREGLNNIKNIYGLKEITRSNEMRNDEKLNEHHINKANEAFGDLADVLGLNHADMGFNGKMSLNINRKTLTERAYAQYYSIDKTITLAEKGPGALAHEWGHALDNIISEAAGNDNLSFATESISSKNKVINAVIKVAQTIMRNEDGTKTEFYQNALDKDKTDTRNERYWSKRTEMFARAFESHISKKLHDKKKHNPYLSRKIIDYDMDIAYPSEYENGRFGKAFDDLMKTINNNPEILKSIRRLMMKAKSHSKGLFKSKVKAHLRRTKSGKLVQVKEHTDKRQKKADSKYWKLTKEEYFNKVHNILSGHEVEIKKHMKHLTRELKGLEAGIVGGFRVSQSPKQKKLLKQQISAAKDQIKKYENKLLIAKKHKDIVKRAISQGEKVPPKVMAGYPELVSKKNRPKPTRFFDAYKDNDAPLEEDPSTGKMKRMGNLGDHAYESDETGKYIRWGAELSDGRKVSLDGVIRITDPERWEKIKDIVIAKSGHDKTAVLIENAMTEKDLEQSMEDIWQEAEKAGWKRQDIGSASFDKWVKQGKFLLSGLIHRHLTTMDGVGVAVGGRLYEIASIKPRKIKGWVKNEVKAKSVLSAVQYYNENKEWVQKTGESKGDFIARESKIPKSMSITTAVDYIKKYFPEIKQSKVKIRESLKELKSKGTGKMGYQSSGAYRATGESGYGSISYSKYATDDIDEWIYDNLPPESKGMSKSKIKAHARRTKSGKVVMVKEHQDSRTKKNSFLDLLLNYDDTEDLKNGESLKKRVKARLKVLKVQRRKLHDEYKKWESKTYKQTKAGMTPGEAREDIHGSARFYTYTQLNEKRKQRRLQAIESKIKTIDNWIDKYSHDLKNTEKYHWSNQYGEYDIPKNTATHTDRNPKNWMNKSRIKQHMRRTKSGKIVVVKEHTDSRTKKEKPAPKPDTDLFGNPIPETNKPPKSEVKELRIQDIEPDPDQPRKEFSEEKLKTLADSIKKIGLIQDIAVRPHPTKQGKYIVIAGERRYRAHKIAGLTHARTRIYDLVDPKDIFAIQVAENVGRKDMNPIETATAFKKLYDVGMPIDEIAKKVSAKAVTVERKMKLLDLIPGLQKHIKDGHVSIHQGWMISNAKLTPEFQHNIMMRLNAGKITNEALSGMIGKYKSAMSQTDIFQVQDAQNTGLGRLNKNTVRTLEMQSDKLIKDVVKLLKQIDEKGGSKINPAIAKEKGKLNLYCDKIDILTEQFTKLKKEADRAKAYFKEGGSVSEYLDSSKVKGNKKWVFVNGKRVLKSMLKAIKGHRGGGHKYIKRLGTKLNYRYVYQNKKVEHADVLLHPHPTDKNRVDVKFDYEWGSQEWTNLKNKIKDIGGYDRKSYDPRRKVWSIKRQDLDELIDKVGTIAVSKDGQLVIHSKDVQADTNTKKKKKKATSQDKAGSRGSVDWWIDIKGKVRYDKKPKGAKEITREEFEKEGIGSRWTLGWLDEKIAEGDKRMADYYARDIEKEAKRILENREAEAGSGALKASTLSKDEKDTTQDDYHAILQYMFSKGYLRVATRGAYKGKMCIDWKVANPDTHRADTKADKLARRLISDIKKWDSPLAPPKLPHFNQDHYKINIVNMITDYNKGEGTTIVNAIFSGDKSKSKKVYDQADKIKDKSKKLDKHMAKAVKAFDSSKEVSISSMKKSVSLWKHQNKYLNWMLTVGKGVIGADTGLGKTLISLSYIKKMKEDKKIDGGLAFLPGSVMYGWQPDLNTFFKGKGKVLYIDGTQKQKMEQIKSIGKKKYDLIVASHGLLQSGGKLLTELMKRTKKHAIFYDESHKGLLNPRNKTYKNFKSKIKQKFVFLLSATPARNEPLDIVHQINLLYDGALGDTKTFHSQYYEQVHNGNSKQWIPNASKMKEMWSRVKPFVPVVNKYSTDIKLPKRVDNTDILSMPKDQDRYYEASAQAFLNAILAVDNPKAMKKSESTHILSTLGAMRRTAFDPRMENPTYTGGSAIFDRASEIIGERLANGKLGTVVASTFVKPFPAYVKMIKEQHGLSDSQIGVITGRTKPKERQAIQNKMNSGKLKLILMGIASGGAGMNLQKGADTLLVMSDPWTYADKKQAVDRIIRPGATSETVFINDFNIQGSITDFVRQKIAMKQQMHSESDHEGAIQENMGKLTFDDYLKIAGITEKEYKRKKKMKKSLKLPQYIHMRKST